MSDTTNANTITAAEMAKRLDGRQYRGEVTKVDAAAAKAAGLVIVYGQSDDLCELSGAINDEAGCFDGGPLRFGDEGFVSISDDDAEVLKRYGVLEDVESKTAKFDAVWCRDEDGPAWTYDVPFPHETFRVFEGDDVYCVGFVFSLREAMFHAEWDCHDVNEDTTDEGADA